MDQPSDCIQVADGRTFNVTGIGEILNHSSSLVPEFENSLLSVSELTKSNIAIAIFTDSKCLIVKLDSKITNLLAKLLQQAKTTNKILIDGNVVNGLYMCGYEDIKKKTE